MTIYYLKENYHINPVLKIPWHISPETHKKHHMRKTIKPWHQQIYTIYILSYTFMSQYNAIPHHFSIVVKGKSMDTIFNGNFSERALEMFRMKVCRAIIAIPSCSVVRSKQSLRMSVQYHFSHSSILESWVRSALPFYQVLPSFTKSSLWFYHVTMVSTILGT